jgi:lipoate-protein ligase A
MTPRSILLRTRPARNVPSWKFGLRHFTTPSLDRPVQSYISTSNNPYLNLSIEHHLLQKSSPDSTILFLYTNAPSIIIGRNQNPWLEVNLSLLHPSSTSSSNAGPNLGPVDLVRRRSGGGTVFHDHGNVNWSFICPPSSFTRDKHAELVVRALRTCGIRRARVNERHDIVLDQGTFAADGEVAADDTHATPYQGGVATKQALKVSGSAYKLTRHRALHHGTCLLSSPNLGVIPKYLRSAGKPFITARGVESVSSPVGNIGLSNQEFMRAVREQFSRTHADSGVAQICEVGEAWLEVENVRKGYEELKVSA